MGAQILTGQPFTRVTVDTSGATINLNMNSRAVMFVQSANIAAPKTIDMGGAEHIFQEFKFRFTLTGLHAITWPANFLMADVAFDPVTKIWTPLNAGDYEASATFNGTNWYLSIVGLFA